MVKNPKPPKKISRKAELKALSEAYRGVQPLTLKKKRGVSKDGIGHKDDSTDLDSTLVEHELLQLLNHNPKLGGSALFHVQWDNEGEVTAYRKNASISDLHFLSNKKFRPEARMDLHGMRSQEVEPKVTSFVRNQYQRGFRRLLMIHGKGKHSEGGVGILADCLVNALTYGRAARYVQAFCTANLKHGGSGALVVLLIK